MKKISYILLIITLVSISSKAQNNPPLGAFSSILLEEKNDSLYFNMEVDIHNKTVNPYQSLTIIPELVTSDDKISHTFPSILINGKKKAQLYRRNKLFNKDNEQVEQLYILVDASQISKEKLNYNIAIPYELWMDTATLKVHQIIGSCANQTKQYTLQNRAKVKVNIFEPYKPEVFINYIEPPLEPKNRNVEESAYLDFQVGKADILPGFRRNPAELAKIDQTIRIVRDNEDITITGVHIEGFASPDGSWATNERLSIARATALKNYISERFRFPEQLFRVSATPEDWDGFRMLIEKSNILEKDHILMIINSSDAPDYKEQRLKSMGSVWRKLMDEYFPSLRRVDYRINFTIRDYTVEESEVLLLRKPDQLSPFELFRLAERYAMNSDEWFKLIHLTVELYPTDVIGNINMAALYLIRGEYEKAKIYLDKTSGDPRAYNNLGAYYLLTRDPDRAEEYLKQAEQSNLEGTIKNLVELEKVRNDIQKERRRITN